MRIASISLVKDEADILEGFVRHNLHFVDRMYIIDDRSTDNTPEILRRLCAESDAVRVLEDGWTGAFHQARRTTAAMRLIQKHEDWDIILPLDADEMICASDRAVFEEDLAAIPAGMAGAFAEMRYLAGPNDDMAIADPLTRVRQSLGYNPASVFKSLAPKALLKDATLAFDEGNHSLLSHGVRVPTHTLPRVPLAHFAIRSVDQIAVKCMKHYVGWRSREDYTANFVPTLVAGAQALRDEPRFALSPSAAIIPAYCAGYALEAAADRPFTERRGTLKWPELAVSPPYAQVIGLFDQLIARAAAGDALVKAAGGDMSADAVARVIAERNALQLEMDRLTASTSKLARAYWKAVGRRLFRSLRKRNLVKR
ncbi:MULTISPECIES: glycosyltransferase family 2 protein [Azorhizobium]|nr:MULTISPECIES: glycosyltransferase family 2 protein [Azorhizobium]TDT90344.1 glycosyl transferase family 2 [Azorhizobium sp. AG788]